MPYHIILSTDEHHSEYLSPADKRLQHFTNFTGSAGTAIIGPNFKELATDGRYWQQATLELKPGFTLRKEGKIGVKSWIVNLIELVLKENTFITVDSRFIPYELVNQFRRFNIKVEDFREPILDTNSPKIDIFPLGIENCGLSSSDKIGLLRSKLTTDFIVLYALDEIAYLLNLRCSGEIEFNPVFKSFLLVSRDSVELFVDSDRHRLPYDYLSKLQIKISEYESIYKRLEFLGKNKSILVPQNSSWALAKSAGEFAVLDKVSPVRLMKLVKNEVEISGMQISQVKCGSAIVSLLASLQSDLNNGLTITEYEASLRLNDYRKNLPNFRGASFATISASGPNAAIIHYVPSSKSRNLSLNEVYLLDSGCQFINGTTDTTRTCWFGLEESVPPQISRAYTLVLKGHIALATQKFPKGTHGYKLDTLARQFLWMNGFDYNHGTGHGVGVYLNVHEGPVGISSGYSMESVPLESGNIVSNEPGVYIEGEFGIRLESLVLVKGKDFLSFETLTLVPFDRKLIDVDLLSDFEIEWVNNYHRRVEESLNLGGEALEYLLYHTAPLKRTGTK